MLMKQSLIVLPCISLISRKYEHFSYSLAFQTPFYVNGPLIFCTFSYLIRFFLLIFKNSFNILDTNSADFPSNREFLNWGCQTNQYFPLSFVLWQLKNIFIVSLCFDRKYCSHLVTISLESGSKYNVKWGYSFVFFNTESSFSPVHLLANLSELRELVKDREDWRAVIHGVAKSRTWLSNWTEYFSESTNETLKQFSGPKSPFFQKWKNIENNRLHCI